jgi:hypothetical protein
MTMIKLIWDFKGPEATKIAEHHAIHLREFIMKEQLENMTVGEEAINEFHHMAFVIVEDKDMIMMRDALRPHRGEYV